MTLNTALMLEDSRTQANIITGLIEAQGWSTVHCLTVNEAIDVLKTISVQALFIDVFVGRHNTIGLLPRFRRMAPDAPLIVMTAGSANEDIETTLESARQARADYVLRKPFDQAQVRQIFQAAFCAGEARTSRNHILIVDDSSTVRKFAGTALEAAGYSVSVAASMEEAIGDPDIAHVDLALCDVFMPGMGGLKGMRHIKKIWPHIKIIAMSAGVQNYISDAEALSAARDLGADGQISKPFSTKALLDVIDLGLKGDAVAEYID
ncbi:response regulator [Asticcacaulis sp. AC402]|uniref:response regulator n=1 Tax=Asticcacaulis sp. AC402 TaxID=1282361 RepID=UPI0003C3C274|nr:response regulator [Asticcacaulis sp. AC402]ESQ77116.1 hypothetical protein ABAC402_01590 [Asticcacaulis sp. AC402]